MQNALVNRILLSAVVLFAVSSTAATVYGNVIYSGPQDILLQGVPDTFQRITIHLAGDAGTWDLLDLGIAGTSLGGGTNTIYSGAEVALAANSGLIMRLNLGDPFPAGPVFGSGGEILWGFGTGPRDGDFFAAALFGTFGTGPAFSGWVHLNVQGSSTNTASLRVVDWAYSDRVGETIAMGQVPEPSTFSFLALSFVAGALFRIVKRRPRSQGVH